MVSPALQITCLYPVTGSAAPAPSPLLTGLVEYWDLDESSGTRVGKHAGLDLTDNNTVGSGLGVDGVSTAADFETGNTEYLSRADEAALDFGDEDQHICGWFNCESAAFLVVLSKGYDEYEVAVQANGRLQVTMGNGAGDYATAEKSAGTITTATFYFVEARFVAATNSIGVSLNGGAWTEQTYASRTSATNAFNIGRRSGGGGAFDGLIQCVGLWRRLLTDDERTWLFNSGTAARNYAAVAAYTG